jgi:hypothetical protein
MNDQTQTHAERRAWRILVSFFAVFLLLCGTSIYLIQWYIFQSTTNLDADLKVARGTVSIILPNTQEAIAVTNERLDLTPGTVIQTDEKSQAIITFRDPESGQPVASVVVLRDSEIVLDRASAPRFSLNVAPFSIRITGQPGRNEVSILPDTPRLVQAEVNTPEASIRISESGLYAVEVTNNITSLTVRSGQADIAKKDTFQYTAVSENNRMEIDTSTDTVEVPQTEQPLIADDTFGQSFDLNWIYRNEGDPAGEVENTTLDGRKAVVIDRSQSSWPNLTLNHGATGLVQTLEANVTEYAILELRLTFYIDEQSLQVCGIDGSECPLMVHITYTDASGVQRSFYHGFYALSDNSQGYPIICNSCRSEHERIALKSWYTYDENLRSLFPAEQQPTTIHEIYFYASGHAYRVYVAEMSLLGIPNIPDDEHG